MIPPARTTRVTVPGVALPVATSRAKRAAKKVSPTVVRRKKRRRSMRSAIAPPTGENTPMGTKAAAATSPAQNDWWVMSVTRAPTATVCIHDPALETSAALQIRVKLRWRSGRSDENCTLRRVGGPPFDLPGARADQALALQHDPQVVQVRGSQGRTPHVDDTLLEELDQVLVEGLHPVVLAVGDDLGHLAAELGLGDALLDAPVGDHDLENRHPALAVGG